MHPVLTGTGPVAIGSFRDLDRFVPQSRLHVFQRCAFLQGQNRERIAKHVRLAMLGCPILVLQLRVSCS